MLLSAAWPATLLLLLLAPASTALGLPSALQPAAGNPSNAAVDAPRHSSLGKRQQQQVAVVRGVNLGGWLVTESWITPSLYASSGAAVPDEWHLGAALGKRATLALLSSHWSSFYARTDLEDIKAAGLTHVRIPLGYWAVDVRDDEPYVGGQYPFLIRAVNWAKELGLGVMIDLHGLPGSQNGQDNSGRTGAVHFAANTTNLARTLGVLRNLTEEFTQAVYGGAVEVIEIANEPRLYSNATGNFTMSDLKGLYASASEIIRSASEEGMTVGIHDAFWGPGYWAGYDPSADAEDGEGAGAGSPEWLELDTHQYYAFAPKENLPRDQILDSICNVSKQLKAVDSGIPQTVVGEWSLETGTPPNASTQDTGLSREKRTWLRLAFEAQTAAYEPSGANQSARGWYFWCWKTQYGYATWDYRSGIANGYIPSDISNLSLRAYPLLISGDGEGCVDAGFNYSAPARARPDGVSGAGRTGGRVGWKKAVGWASGGLVLALL